MTSTTSSEIADDANRIPTNLRMLLIFEALATSGRPMTPSELGELIDLPKPTLHRLCTTLESEGFLIRDHHSGRLRPAQRARVMATGLQKVSRLHIARRLILKTLANQIEETCNVAVPSVAGMIYLDRVDTPWPLRFQLPVGTEVPFHCTASGKLFLASFNERELRPLLDAMDLTLEGPNSLTDKDALIQELDQIRTAKYSWDNQEFMAGMVAFAVPINDRQGRFAGALAFHAPMQRVDFEAGKAHIPTLRDAANHIETVMFDEDEAED